MKLLIAEDDALFRNILKRELSSEHELVFANDGNQAWAALQGADSPRLAILDWVMPGLTGPQICRNIRASARLSAMYLILFTARNSAADVVSGMRAGADDYVTKPFSADELRIRIKLGELLLDLQDAAEMRAQLTEEKREREISLHEYADVLPVTFTQRPVGNNCLYSVENSLIQRYEPVAHLNSESDIDLAVTPQPQYFLETLHA
ncbi:MAG TPA: response regulator [Candidatus Aquilonibacter sp.]|nr:response regulator [Candidatus Aquilonibacter sp.]